MPSFFSFRTDVPKNTYPNICGVSVQVPNPGVKSNARSHDRYHNRRAFNYHPAHLNTDNAYAVRKIGAFRAFTNAGDSLIRKNYSCGGSNQLGGSRPGMLHLTLKDGGPSSAKCDKSGIPPSSCNVKYVYDSSNFTRFKKNLVAYRSVCKTDYSM